METRRAQWLILATSGDPPHHPSPYPRGHPPDPQRQKGDHPFDVGIKRAVSLVGLAGFIVLILMPSLRDPLAWAMVAGAAGVFPLDRFLERRGI